MWLFFPYKLLRKNIWPVDFSSWVITIIWGPEKHFHARLIQNLDYTVCVKLVWLFLRPSAACKGNWGIESIFAHSQTSILLGEQIKLEEQIIYLICIENTFFYTYWNKKWLFLTNIFSKLVNNFQLLNSELENFYWTKVQLLQE